MGDPFGDGVRKNERKRGRPGPKKSVAAKAKSTTAQMSLPEWVRTHKHSADCRGQGFLRKKNPSKKRKKAVTSRASEERTMRDAGEIRMRGSLSK